MKAKFLASVLTGAMFAIALAGCGGQQGGSTAGGSAGGGGAAKVAEVKIGNILPLSGPAAPLGELGKKARELAAEEINAAGGIKSLGGAKLKLIFADSQGKPQVGVAEAERLITQEKVSLLTGTYQSGVAIPVSEVAERYKVPFFAPVPSDDSITQRGFKYLWRLADTSEMRVIAQSQFLDDLNKTQGAGLKTVYLIYENTAWGQGVAKSWKKYLPEKGFQIVGEEAYPQGSSDFTPLANKVKAANPDVVLLTSYVADASLLTNTFAEQKVTPKVFLGTSGGYSDPVYLKNTGENAEYFFDVSSWETDVRRPHVQEINEKFQQKFGVLPSNEAVKAYVAMYVIKDVLERAGSLEADKIRDAFNQTNITEGITQVYAPTIKFDDKGQMISQALVIAQYRKVNGKIERVTVWPEKEARSPEFKPVLFPGWDKK
ncbi:ABC transporter substrate-binding protein [Caldinitratiruptor microaerophilus]|uniref:Amino acid ABC transporter substrate-binding protein n=1 Tax=Caldinitratiruptor microaerophilus TaxID=671077 RepID=A0AA35CIR0_9FIRM|nr:ABC transporter substrate-binding protein [Caldinitratiruptor microaerophilus]BDG59063.1 amino acid ABC transporter substrate-binding protein [Caldinitratiruptor microaerophilus]